METEGSAQIPGRRPDPQVLSDPERQEATAALVALGPTDLRVQELTSLAARLLGAPFAQLSLLNRDEQVIAAEHGQALAPADRRGPLADSLCTVTAASGATLPIADTASHPWVAHLPPVRSGAVGAYLGAVLRDRGGQVLGSVCVFDAQPRAWTDQQVAILEAVTDAVAAALGDAARAGAQAAAGARLDLAMGAGDLGSYEYDLQTGRMVWDDRMRALHGWAGGETGADVGAWLSAVHPDDRMLVTDRLAAVVGAAGDLSVEYRVALPSGATRWVAVRGRVLTDMLGQPARLHGVALDRSADRDVRDDLARLFETLPAGFLRCRDDWTVTYLNAAAAEILGPRRDVVGANLWDVFPEARGSAFEDTYVRVRDTREPGRVEGYFAPFDAHVEVHCWPDAGGLSFFFLDVGERRRAQIELERVSERLSVLAAAGERLSATLSPREVLDTLAAVLVPDLAASLVLAVAGDVAALLGADLVADPDRLYVAHAAHADPAVEPLLVDMAHKLTLSRRAEFGMGRTARTGEPQFMARVPEEHLVAHAVDEQHLAALRLLYGEATLSVPIRTPQGVFGSLTVVANPGADLDELLIADVAHRAAVALQNALVFVRQGREATALQRGLLPRGPAGLPGVVIATRYRPATSGSLAGGDFFKTIQVGTRLVAVLGDVMGHGSVSAARAGQLHSVVAALALEGHSPTDLLHRLASGSDQILELELATLLVCSYDPAHRRLTVASAGHPPPLYAPCVGEPYFVGVEPGPPLGVAVGEYPEHTVALEAGSTLVLYSDGLIERRTRGIGEGMERLRQALRELRLPPEAVADHILNKLDAGGDLDDDVALLVLSHL